MKSVTVADPPDNGSENAEQIDESVYNVNLFRIRDSELKPKVSSKDFKVKVLIKNHLDKVLADTGAGILVCGIDTAKRWNLLSKMSVTRVRIKPYKSNTIPAVGVSTCGVSFGSRTISVHWYIIKES